MDSDPLSAVFHALADPTRRAILARLAEGEKSVGQLAKPFVMSLPAISRHLKVLEKAGLITRGRNAQWRPCRIDPDAFRGVDLWLDQVRGAAAGKLDLQGVQVRDLKTTENDRVSGD